MPFAAPARRRRRRWLSVTAWLVGCGAGLAIAALVLVALRTGTVTASGNALTDRLDTAIAETSQADRLLSLVTWVAYVTTTVVLGGAVYHLFVAPLDDPGGSGAPRSAPGRSSRYRSTEAVYRAAVLVGLAAVGASIPLRAAVVTGDGVAGALDPGNLWFVVTSRFGEAAAVRAAGLGILALTLGQGPFRRAVCFVGSIVVLLSYVLVGHPQSTPPVAVEITAHAVHVASAATWFGGVAFLAVDLRQRRREGALRPSAAAVVRFSELAEMMVILVICSGAVLAGSQLPFDRVPWSSGYGQAFVAKLGFVGLVLALGGYNRQRVVPAIDRDDDELAWRQLRRTALAEAVLIPLGVLLMTAAMTSGGF